MTSPQSSSGVSQTVALSLAAAVGAVVFAGFVLSTSAPPPPKESRRVEVSPEREALREKVKKRDDARTVAHASKLVEAQITANLTRAEKRADDWLSLEHAASGLLLRSRLTGDLDDLSQAEALLEKAFSRAPEGSGPFMTLATVQMTQHKFAEVEKTLDAYDKAKLRMRSQLVTALGLRGDLALQRGQYQEAADLYRRASEMSRKDTTADVVRMADVHLQLGELEKAIEVVDAALAAPQPKEGLGYGWLLLRRGILDLDAGRTEEALAWFDKADQAFQGWYLIEEHRAECLAALGKLAEAEALYRKVLEKNKGPEYLVALADVLEEQGKVDEAAALASQADAAFMKQLEEHPEAMFGHALDHFLEGESVDDVKLAADLAEKNHALRPGGQAKVKLAMAWVRTGRIDEAQKLIDDALALGHRSADLFATRAFLLTRRGDAAGAEKAMAEAEKLDRRARGGYDWLRSVP